MSRENYDNYDQEDLGYYAADHSASDAINSETMGTKDPAVNQHENDSQRHKHMPEFEDEDETSDSFSSEKEENDTSDPYFQKNASIAQDLDEDLKDDDDEDDDDESFDNDANRRTLDEKKADEDEEDY